MTSCQIRDPHGGRLGLWPRPSQTPNKGFALARGPQLRHSNRGARVNVNYNKDGEV